MLKLGNTFFRETESVYLFLCTAIVNSILWNFFCKLVALEFVTLCDDLFNNLIFFFDSQCTAKSDNTLYGTCYTASECASKGGTADGNCAAGFGACCTFT